MKKLNIIYIVLTTLFLSGCWDRIEIEEFAFVSVIGINEGQHGKPRITFQITNPDRQALLKFK